MGAINVRNIPDDVHRLLKAQASENNRSTEAEVRNILETVVRRRDDQGFGQALRSAWSEHFDLEIERSSEMPRTADFS